MSTYFCILTAIGEAKLANATALGQTLEFSQMALGDGGGSMPIPSQSREALVNEVRRAPLNAVAIDEDNPNWIVCEQIVPAEVGGWTIRELGIIDADGDLVAVGNFPETYKPILAEGSGRTQTVRMVLQVSNSASVTLKIDPSVVLATREYVDDAKEAAEDHADSGDASTLAEAKSYANEGDAWTLSAAQSHADNGDSSTLAAAEQKDLEHVQDDNPHPQYNANLVGAVQSFASSSAPSGWLKANGAEVNRTSYAALFEIIGTTFGAGDGATTFNLPDLRGEFIRGWDDGRGVDSGREFASFQESDNKAHGHGMDSAGNHRHTFWGTHTSQSPIVWSDGRFGLIDTGGGPARNGMNYSGDHAHNIHSSGGSEARPRSIALLFCIKY